MSRKLFELAELEYLDIKTENTDGKRFYITPTGEKYPSVTTVTGLNSREHIKLWRERVGEETANRITTQAARRGTKMHQYFEDYLKKEKDVIEFDNIIEQSMFTSVQPLLDEIIPIAIEAPLFSHNLEMAGRVDCVGIFEDEVCIIDFKTASKHKEEKHVISYFLQETAYAMMVEEMTGERIDNLVTIVAIEGGHSQLFTCEPYGYREKLIELREQYRNLYKV
jgi:genome maintenance exonuclease 1